MAEKRKSSPADEGIEDETSVKRQRTERESAIACCPVVMVLADTLLDDKLDDARKVGIFSSQVAPVKNPTVHSVGLTCQVCGSERVYSLRTPQVGPNLQHMSQRVRDSHLLLRDLRAGIQSLGIYCPTCSARAMDIASRWKDGHNRNPPVINTKGQLVKGMIATIEILFGDHQLIDALRTYQNDATIVDKTKMQMATKEDNDTMQAYSKTLKSMSDAQMREDDGLCRDPVRNKQMVSECNRVLVSCSYIPNTENRPSRDPRDHDYESMRAAEQSIKMRPVEIYSRDDTFFLGMMCFTFGDHPLPNLSVPPEEEYLYIATRHKTSQSPLTVDRKVFVEGPSAKDGYFQATTVRIPYHYPMVSVGGGVVPECRQYVKQYARAVRRYEDAYAELCDKSLAIEQMRREVQNEAACDLEVALSRCLYVDNLSCGSIAEASSQETTPESPLSSNGEAFGNSSSDDGSMGAAKNGSDISITGDSDSEMAPGPAKPKKSCELIGDPNLGQTEGFQISSVTTSPDISAANEVQNVDEQTQDLAGTNHKDMRPTMLGSTGLTSMLTACTTEQNGAANSTIKSIGKSDLVKLV